MGSDWKVSAYAWHHTRAPQKWQVYDVIGEKLFGEPIR